MGAETDRLSLDIDMDGRTITKMHCICCGPSGECDIQIRMWNLVPDYAEKAIFKFEYGSSDVQQESWPFEQWSCFSTLLVGIEILSPSMLSYFHTHRAYSYTSIHISR